MISFEKIGLRYDLNSEILHDVSFTIAPKSFQFLSGPSGAGKTTLLKMMALNLSPTRGLINIFGFDTSRLKANQKQLLRRDIGVVFQDFRLLDHLTAYENVALAFRVRGKDEAIFKSQAIELLNWVGLSKKINSHTSALSGGEKQRVAIARAVITKPKLLLADEPTGNVDKDLAKRLLRVFLELNKFGTAVVLATHDTTLLDIANARRLSIENKKVVSYE